MTPDHSVRPRRVAAGALLLVMVALPYIASGFFVNFVVTRTLILGVAAATIVFLSAYAGVVSMAQLLMWAVAGFMFGNASLKSGARGLNLGWNPWVAVVFALAVTAVVGLILGLLASRSAGIYFLMLTLVYGVIGYFVFAQVVTISGPGGLTEIAPPRPITSAVHLYFAALLLSVVAYAGLRAIVRTPFGLALQGVRDDPIRMASLGFNVALHRALAFALAGVVAGAAGLLNVWWNGQIDPASVALGPTLLLLIVAVIGGISHLEGAWIGAFVYVSVMTYLRNLPLVDRIGITEARFSTVIGLVMLLIMLLSPEGLVGIALRARRSLSRRRSASYERVRSWRGPGSPGSSRGLNARVDASGRQQPSTTRK